jgi:hypothetical protein
MTQDIVRQLEASIQESKEFVELSKALERLESNRDFKAVVLDGYLEQEAIRLVHLKANPQMQSAERQAVVLAQIDAIGNLVQYFNTVYQKASMAAKAIESAQAEIEALNEEEA